MFGSGIFVPFLGGNQPVDTYVAVRCLLQLDFLFFSLESLMFTSEETPVFLGCPSSSSFW